MLCLSQTLCRQYEGKMANLKTGVSENKARQIFRKMNISYTLRKIWRA